MNVFARLLPLWWCATVLSAADPFGVPRLGQVRLSPDHVYNLDGVPGAFRLSEAVTEPQPLALSGDEWTLSRQDGHWVATDANHHEIGRLAAVPEAMLGVSADGLAVLVGRPQDRTLCRWVPSPSRQPSCSTVASSTDDPWLGIAHADGQWLILTRSATSATLHVAAANGPLRPAASWDVGTATAVLLPSGDVAWQDHAQVRLCRASRPCLVADAPADILTLAPLGRHWLHVRDANSARHWAWRAASEEWLQWELPVPPAASTMNPSEVQQ